MARVTEGGTDGRESGPDPAVSPAHRAEAWLGRTASRRVRITAAMVEAFADLSGDASPIHVDDGAARARGYPARVVHGLLLGSLVSSVLGMQLPGEQGVLQEVKLSFRHPCHPGDEVEIQVTAAEFFESVQAVGLKVRVVRGDGLLLATGQARSGLV